MLQTTGTVDCCLEEIEYVMEDFKNRAKWDANFQEGGVVKELGANSQFHYVRTRRVAVVSSRDAYTAIRKMNRDPSNGLVQRHIRTKGKVLRSMIIACKSVELGDDITPSASGIVRIICYLTGYFVQEVESNEVDENGKKKIVCDVIFFSNVDVKISQFIMR